VILALILGCVATTWAASTPSSRALVSHVMALLSVFEQADALPPENSAEANELIHALIQTQAALTKSTDPATRRWFSEALHATAVEHKALTSRALEAILAYSKIHPPEKDPAVLAGFREFNVSRADFVLMGRVYGRAVTHLQSTGQDIHELYEQQRQTMPFR
jgi:hypothetical protein